MTIKGVLFRFFLVYAMLAILIGNLMSHFDIKGRTGINIVILAVSVLWVCLEFGRKNGRYFSGSEKISVIFGLLAVDLLLQTIFGAAALSQSSSGINYSLLIFLVGFVGVFHAIAIYFFVGVAKKQLAKKGIITS